jgi:hypothetical protein
VAERQRAGEILRDEAAAYTANDRPEPRGEVVADFVDEGGASVGTSTFETGDIDGGDCSIEHRRTNKLAFGAWENNRTIRSRYGAAAAVAVAACRTVDEAGRTAASPPSTVARSSVIEDPVVAASAANGHRRGLDVGIALRCATSSSPATTARDAAAGAAARTGPPVRRGRRAAFGRRYVRQEAARAGMTEAAFVAAAFARAGVEIALERPAPPVVEVSSTTMRCPVRPALP